MCCHQKPKRVQTHVPRDLQGHCMCSLKLLRFALLLAQVCTCTVASGFGIGLARYIANMHRHEHNIYIYIYIYIYILYTYTYVCSPNRFICRGSYAVDRGHGVDIAHVKSPTRRFNGKYRYFGVRPSKTPRKRMEVLYHVAFRSRVRHKIYIGWDMASRWLFS